MENIKNILFGKHVRIIGFTITALVIMFVIAKVTFINKLELNKAIKDIVPNLEVRSQLIANGVTLQSTIFADAEYNLLAKDWIEANAQPKFVVFLDELGFTQWEKNNSDCDDFAKAFTVFLKSYLKKLYPDVASPAVGEIYYTQKTGGDHAINIIVLRGPKGSTTIGFFEPQIQRFVTLTKKEIESIFFISI
jgi:hypothetical protein